MVFSLLVFHPNSNKPPVVNPDSYTKINIREFVHNIYINCARQMRRYLNEKLLIKHQTSYHILSK